MGLLDLLGSVLPYSVKVWEWQWGKVWSCHEMPDMTGQFVVCTGANGGVGLEACFQLYRKGASVVMCCRSEEKFTASRGRILARLQPSDKRSRHGTLHFVKANLSTIRHAQESAERILALPGLDRLDVFLACASRGSKLGAVNEDGVEPFMAANCLGHLAMLQVLLPLIVKTSKGKPNFCRIVFVSSVAEQWSSLPWPLSHPASFASWEDINDPKRGEQALYAASKLAQILTVKCLNWELGNENISCLAVHPGELDNLFTQNMIPSGLQPILRPLLRLFLLNEYEGARACLFAATAKEIDEQSWRGLYVSYPAQIRTPSRKATDMSLANQIWRLQTTLITERTRKTV